MWSVLKAKRRKLLYQDGFISHFYGIMEHLSPVLAWGFLGPESDLKKSCFIFKVNWILQIISHAFNYKLLFFFQEQVEGYLQDVFNFERVRYVTVEEMAEDVWTLARQRRETITRQMPRRWRLPFQTTPFRQPAILFKIPSAKSLLQFTSDYSNRKK